MSRYSARAAPRPPSPSANSSSVWICSSFIFAVRNGWSGMTDPIGREGLLVRVAEDERAVAVEREGRRLGRGPGRHHEPATLLVAQDHVGRPGRVLDGADGGRARARGAARRARWRAGGRRWGAARRPHSSTLRGPGRGRPEPRGATVIDMAAGRRRRPDGSTRRVTLRKGSKGLDGARIFSAMSSGLRARADRARTPSQARSSADPLPTRRRDLVRQWRPSRGGSGEGVPGP